MQVFRSLAGYSYGRADLVRKAMGKKKKDVMEAERQSFLYGRRREDGSLECPGAVANGVPAAVADAHLRRDGGLCGVRLQQGPRHGVFRGQLSDGVSEVSLSPAVPGGAVDLGAGKYGEAHGVSGGVQKPGHPGAAAGRQLE